MSGSLLTKLMLVWGFVAACYGQVYYNGTRQLSLGSDKIVWSDDQYIELYGKSVSFIVDLHSEYERFRNHVNLSESNVSLDGMFRARGSSYPKTITPSCTYINKDDQIKLEPYFLVDKNQTYFTVKNSTFTLATLDENCGVSIDNFNQAVDISSRKQLVKLGEKYLGIKISKTMLIINLQLMAITQKLDLSPCYPTSDQEYELNFNMDSKEQSWQLTISTTHRLCVYERLSANGNFNFLKQIRLDFPELASMALINSSVGFIMTKNCTLVRLSYSGLKSQQQHYDAVFADSIVGYNEYTTRYYNYDNVGFIILNTGEVYSLLSSIQYYIKIPLQAQVTIIKAASCRQSNTDSIRYYYITSDWKLKQYIAGGATTVMNSAKDYNFTTLDSLDITDVGLRVYAAGVINAKLVVASINGAYDQLLSTWSSALPESLGNYYATEVRAGYNSNRKYSHFYVIVKNLQTSLLTCYSYGINNGLIQQLGWYPMNSRSFQFGRLIWSSEDSKIFWHEVVKGKDYIFQANSQLEVVRYFAGYDFESFTVGGDAFRILRTSGRSDFYLYYPTEEERYGSFYTENPSQESFTLLTGTSPYYLYIESNASSKVYGTAASSMFISRTMAQRPANLCAKTITPPILSSPRSAYTIFISTTGSGASQQLVIYLTYFQPYYGYYSDRIYTIKMSYNDSVTFAIKSNKYNKQSNSLFLQLIPSNDRDKVMLATLKLDYLEDSRDYAIWDWIYEFPKAEVEQYEISAGNMMVYGEGGKRITRFQTGGISPALPWYFNAGVLPYLIAKGAKIGIYLINNSYHSMAINLKTGQELYTFTNTVFTSISPNGKLLMLRNESQPSTITIYKQSTLLGRVFLQSPASNTSLLSFMSDDLMLFIEGNQNYRNLYVYKLSENPFQYTTSTFQYPRVQKQPLITFNSTHIGFLNAGLISIFNRELVIVQNLSISPMGGHEPESISLAEGGNIYAKFNNILHIWIVGECKDGKKNQDGICSEESGPSGGALIGIILGVVGGVAVAGVGGFFLFKKLRARNKMESPLLEENKEQIMTGTDKSSFKNQDGENLD